jgi:putative phosphoribosyl transferase
MASAGRYLLPFPDRRAAGRALAEELKDIPAERTVVLGLPRGGVAVAHEVAARLGAPLDVIVTRKIGYPPSPELGVGAIAEGGEPVYDSRLLDKLGITPADLSAVVAAEEAELARRVRVYRAGHLLREVAGLCVLVVDDGLATGVTARAALRSLRAAGAGLLVLAVPVAPPSAMEAMRAEADRVVILATPRRFSSVGEWYVSFGQLSDADVLALLTTPALRPSAHPSSVASLRRRLTSGVDVRSAPSSTTAASRYVVRRGCVMLRSGRARLGAC